MSITLLIASTTRNGFTRPGSISYSKTLGQPQTMQFSTSDPGGGFYPDAGNDTELQHNSVIKFSGRANTVDRIRRNANIGPFETQVSCVDNKYRLTQRLVAPREWISKTVLEIATDVVTDYLGSDLSDVSLVEIGPTLASFRVEDYTTAADLFDTLASAAAMFWDVNELNQLRLFARLSNAAPFSITNSSNNITKLTIRESLEDYCNVAVGFVGQAVRDPATETFTGDGSMTTFELSTPVSEAPTITVNGVDQTVGVQDVDTGKDWYWSKGSNQIRQVLSPPAPLTGSDTLAVNYKGTEQLYVFSENTAAIAARALIEGNSGRYERRLDISGIISKPDAQAAVDNYVAVYSEPQLIAIIETNDLIEPQAKNLDVGDILSITIDGWAGIGDYLVQSIRAQAYEKNDQAVMQFSYAIEAVNGPKRKNYVDYFKGLGGGGGGTISAVGGSGSGGVYQETINAGVTHTSAYAPVSGATLVVRVYQPGDMGIGFDVDQFAIYNNNIASASGTWTLFTFTGIDGKWWQSSTVTGIVLL